ncbi:MAG: transglutaminaseTgpA domain-containing protein [Planctomycetota bacterium]
MKARHAENLLSVTALAALGYSGALPRFLVPAALAILLAKYLVLDLRGRQFPATLLQVLQTLQGALFLAIAFVVGRKLDLLTALMIFGVVFLILRNLAIENPFKHFTIVVLSLLLCVGAAAIASGWAAIVITACLLLSLCYALPALYETGKRVESVHLAPVRLTFAWRLFPVVALTGLAAAGLLLGALLFFIAPRIRDETSMADSPLDIGARPEPRSGAGQSPGFPDEPSIGDIGRVKRDGRLMLQARISMEGSPYDPTRSEARLLLLRLRAWDRYDMRRQRWTRSRVATRPLPTSGRISDGDAPMHWEIETFRFEQNALFVPQRARRVHGPRARQDGLGNLTTDERWTQYAIEAGFAGYSDREMRGFIAGEEAGRLFEVPKGLHEPLDSVLLGERGGHWLDSVQFVRRFFHGFRYTLDLPPNLPRDTDPIVAFLERREGHCELFASTACLLLRRMGVPARFVGGARCAIRAGPGVYQAKRSNAHAWVEIPLQDLGFIAFDFTPPDSQALPPTGGGDGVGEAAGESTDGAESDESGLWKNPLDYDWMDQREMVRLLQDSVGTVSPGPVLMVFAALFLLLAIPWRRPRRRNALAVTSPKGVSRKTLKFYARFLRACAKAGHRRARTQTPREFLATLPAELAASGTAVTGEFEKRRYGGRA